jgi:hypothetical protein
LVSQLSSLELRDVKDSNIALLRQNGAVFCVENTANQDMTVHRMARCSDTLKTKISDHKLFPTKRIPLMMAFEFAFALALVVTFRDVSNHTKNLRTRRKVD